MRKSLFVLVLTGACLLPSSGNAILSQQPAPPKPQDVPVMDGEAGPCSIEFTVTASADGKPVYPALIKVRIAYGFGGFHKLDLSAYTNYDGKVKFIGIPASVHKPPLEFRATKDQLTGVASWNPDGECTARHDMVRDVNKTRKPTDH